MKPLSKFGLCLAFLVSASSSLQGDCKCEPPAQGETTHWGGNTRLETNQKTPVRSLRGRVERGGRPIQGALVEVFASDGHVPKEQSDEAKDRPQEQRIAVCRTGADGKFCFQSLPSGKYELRSSVDTDWDVTFVYVVVDTRAGKKDEIRVPMQLGN